MEAAGVLRGRRLIALPFSDHCAPLLLGDRYLSPLLDALGAFRQQREIGTLEIRWALEEAPGTYRGEAFYLHETDLAPDPETVIARFHRTRVRQPIALADRAGIVIRRAEGMEDLRTFYRLHLRTRSRLGTPVQPFRFFSMLRERLLLRDLGFILLAEHGGRAVAGGVFLHWNGTLTYKFGASDPESRSHAPNHALLLEAIRWGCREGMTRFDWGRTEPAHEGLRAFKRGWGAREVLSASTILADRPPPPGGGGMARARSLMSGCIRHSPQWVCRAIGELFYGQFA